MENVVSAPKGSALEQEDSPPTTPRGQKPPTVSTKKPQKDDPLSYTEE